MSILDQQIQPLTSCKSHNTAMKRSRSRSPIRLNERPKVYADCDVLYIKNTPRFWDSNRVKQFIIESCKSKAVIEGIKNIIILKGEHNSEACLVKFVNSFPCNLALTELPGTVCNGKKIEVSLDIDNLYQEEYKQLRLETYKRGTGVGPRKSTQSLQQINNQQQAPQPLLQFSMNNMSQQNDTPAEYETYGLSKSFLKALNIKLPLLDRIFIGNLDPSVNEAKLREVFSYAGQIMQVLLIFKDKQRPIAKIIFDHPVEAVQAIAMFNNQELHNKTMLVQMDSARQFNNIPKGLSGFGPGLGVNGEPLRGVRTHIELQPLKNLLMQEIEKLKEKTSQAEEQPMNVINPGQMDSNVINPFNPNVTPIVNMNPFIQPNPLLNLTGVMNTQGLQNLQLLQNLIQQNSSGNNDNSQIPFANVQNQFLQTQSTVQPHGRNILSDWSSTAPGGSRQIDNCQQFQSRLDSDFNSRGRTNSFDDALRNNDDRDNRSRSRWDQEAVDEKPQISTSDMLVFNNLPSTVTVQALNSKMREVGDVKFVELTGYGRALVRFIDVRDAERCLNLFHKSKVDGNTIDVRFF